MTYVFLSHRLKAFWRSKNLGQGIAVNVVKFQGTSIVSSHDLNHITDLCTRILLLEKGKIVKDLQTDGSTLQDLEEYFSVSSTLTSNYDSH